MEFMAVCHPIPTQYAKRIYNDNKTVYVGKSFLKRVPKGGKFLIYESHGARAYTGWADIKEIGEEDAVEVLKKYYEKLILTKEEYVKYVKNRKKISFIEFDKFEKFKSPIQPKIYVPMRGKYIRKDEYNGILKRL